MIKLLLFILSYVGGIYMIQAQTTAIPDAAFEQKLIQLGIDSDGLVNGQILNSDAANITRLNVSSSNISDMTGLAAFVNLRALTCHSNNLTTIDLAGCPQLDYLHCLVNQLVTLDLSNNPSLDTLYCSDNYIDSLDFSNNPTLVWMECNRNSIDSLDFSNNPMLTKLLCYSNEITYLNLPNNPLLSNLNCNFNQLDSLNLDNVTGLVYLACVSNNLNHLDVSNIPNLWNLQCSNNNLSTIDLSNNLNLRQFSIRSNNLTTLDVANNTFLTDLNCNYNELTSLVLSNPDLWSLDCSYNQISFLDVNNSPDIHYLDINDNKLSYVDISNIPSISNIKSQNNLPYLRICIHALQAVGGTQWQPWEQDTSTVYLRNCLPLAVNGQVVMDANNNCIADSIEMALENQMVRFTRLSDSTTYLFSTSDSLGMYEAYLDTGTYTTTVVLSNNYWQVCPSSQLVVIDSTYSVPTVNWTLQANVLCPFLEVDIAAPFLRMTGGGSHYSISYCNTGTIAASNVYIEVDIDTNLNVLGTSLPIASQVGTLYTFNIGTLDVGACGNFNIQVVVDTSAQFQETHCTEVHIYPDSMCTIQWNGPIVDGNISCQNNIVDFTVINKGTAMLTPQAYTIFEDNIAMRVGSVSLGAGQSTSILQPAGVGHTYRIEVNQAAGFPHQLGDVVFSKVIEGCHPFPNGSFNTGFVTQFSNGNSASFIAIDCQQNIASYDPNDKAAQPLGYGLQHYITPNIDIDYKIRFQNTGTDTAFNIIIIDTISSHLDPTTLEMGASSHNYTWSITENILRVDFPNIMLVDSNANEPLSHGFFRYKIEQKANNPIGGIIENQAAIYFDYNPAIFTNTTFHTIEENFVTTIVSVDKVHVENLSVNVYPNPFKSETTIEVEGDKLYSVLELSIFDLSGRQVESLETSGTNQVQLSRGKLESGIYIYKLKGEGQLLNTGKIIVQ